MELTSHKKRTARREKGMSLIEMMIAMVVLLVGLVGSVSLVAISVGNNNRSRMQGNATVLSQLLTEKISSVKATTSPILVVTDCVGNNFNVNTAAPGGAPLTAGGDVDFAQPAVATYQMLYVDCGTAGRQLTYDVRWNIQQPSPYVKILTVSSKRVGSANTDLKLFSLPVTIRTLIGQGT